MVLNRGGGFTAGWMAGEAAGLSTQMRQPGGCGVASLPGVPGTHLAARAGLIITLPTKVCLVKAMVFPVVMYGYESWTVHASTQDEA